MALKVLHPVTVGVASTTPAPAAKQDERRWAQRKPRSLPALLLSDRLQSHVPCVVRDLSSTGARIEIVVGRDTPVRSADGLPDRLTLYMVTDEMEVDCEVHRRDGVFAGLRFTSTTRLRLRPKARRPIPKK